MEWLRKCAYLLLIASVSAVAISDEVKSVSKVITADNISWGHLNPLRGDKSPGAAELWGDRTSNVATGMLVKFNKGFSSPPHIHNISYRAIVINGLMHNDDPTAKEMWMPTGSFWTQPAGEVHITAAQGQENLIYLEIDTGPYLVNSSKASFNNGESPINLHLSNMVWLNSDNLSLVKDASGVEVSSLWGSPKHGELGGSLLKFPKGFSGNLNVDADEFRAVIINGNAKYQSVDEPDVTELNAGSYFYSAGFFEHKLVLPQETLFYIRTNGSFGIATN